MADVGARAVERVSLLLERGHRAVTSVVVGIAPGDVGEVILFGFGHHGHGGTPLLAPGCERTTDR